LEFDDPVLREYRNVLMDHGVALVKPIRELANAAAGLPISDRKSSSGMEPTTE